MSLIGLQQALRWTCRQLLRSSTPTPAAAAPACTPGTQQLTSLLPVTSLLGTSGALSVARVPQRCSQPLKYCAAANGATSQN